jgi:hypothetical protein
MPTSASLSSIVATTGGHWLDGADAYTDASKSGGDRLRSSTNGGRLSLQIAGEWSDTRLTDDLISKPDSALGVDRAGVGGRSGRHGHRLGVE